MKPDEAYARVRKHCLAKKGVVEEYPWGDVAWKVRKKLFAVSSDGSHRVTVKSTLEEQSRLIEHPAIEIASYVGRYGWVTIAVTSRQTCRLALELIGSSYERVARGRTRSAKKR